MIKEIIGLNLSLNARSLAMAGLKSTIYLNCPQGILEHENYRIYSSISRTFLYLKISPKTGVRLILEASEMTCSNHGTYTYENMRLPYLF